MKTQQIHTFNKKLLHSSIFAILTTSMTTQVSAQSSVEEEIIVTGAVVGSRLKNEFSTQPLSQIDREAFVSSGALTASDAINELPQLGNGSGAQNQSINSLNGGFGVGTSTINLRNLGAKRTLVLVNGRRHVGGDPGTASVDLNSIPSAMIENMDVVTGAASAVYGADAVSGVVDITLRDTFEGSQLDVRTGISGESDAEELFLAFTNGGELGDSGSYIFSIEHSTQDSFTGADRDYFDYDGSVEGTSEEDNGSGVNPGGLLSVDLGTGAANGGFQPDGTFVQPFAERFQRVLFRNLQNETERTLLSGKVSFDLSSDSEFFTEFTYSNSVVDVQFEPQLAVFSNSGFASSGTAGFRFPTAPTIDIDVDGDSNADTARVITRRFTEFGPRRSEVDRDLIRFAIGLQGQFDPDGFIQSYDMYYQYGKVEADQTDFDTIDKLRTLDALDPDVCASISGCVFMDVYTGREQINPAALNYIARDLVSTSESEQSVLSGFITGGIGEKISRESKRFSFAFGLEYRDEEVSIEPNDLLIALELDEVGSDLPTPIGADPDTETLIGTQGTRTFNGDTNGNFDVIEVFGEAQYTFTDNFSLRAAARLSDYSTVGSETTAGLNADWQIIPEMLRFRASIGTATRAPNINELFAPAVSVTSTATDLCDDANAPLDASIQANCDQLLAGASNLTTNGLVDVANVGFGNNVREQRAGGSEELDSETAETITVGFVISPTENTTISLDYYEIDMEDVLSEAFNAQVTADRCTLTLDPLFCDNVVRDSNGVITSVTTQQLNLAEELVEGIDVSLIHTFDISNNSSLTLSAQWAHLLDHTRKVNDDADEENLTGRVDNLENKWTLTGTYDHGPLAIVASVRSLDSGVMTTDPVLAESAVNNDVDSVTYLDLYASYDITDTFTLSGGIKNATDEEPPIVTELFEGNGSADVVAGGIHDTRGQFFYISGSYNF